MSLSDLFIVLKGGAGSGNFGHAGIPGRHGGSAPNKVWAKGMPSPGTGSLVNVQKIGQIGEKLAMKVFAEKYGVPFETLNVGINNAPIDVGGDHLALEVKAGSATNSERTQMWRAKVAPFSKKEQALYDKMSPEEKTAYNAYKKQAVLDRKQRLLDELSRELGEPIKPMTVGVILSADGKRADMYAIPGFHISLSWKKYASDEYFMGTYDVEDS
ncbi:hypothetical protein C4588_02900 [Candidatus Parcubacteria bacterium]|nr:MAG: hypothetical protein C4588_02900 [Candidatus Parcubacteria bacterium]